MKTLPMGADVTALETMLRSLLQQELSSSGMKPAAEVHLTSEDRRRTEVAVTRLYEAADFWLAGKISKRLLPKTIECCESNLRNLKLFFGDMPLKDIHAGSFKAYQVERQTGAGAFVKRGPVGVSSVNHELNVLQQILRNAGLWKPIKDFYAPLPEEAWQKPKTFTMHEQQLIFETAAKDPNLELAEIVFTITRNTTASGCELRGLRFCNLEMNAIPPRIHIPPDSVKNQVRPRTIPLNDGALAAVEKAIARAHRLGCHYPEHYLFPLRVNRALWNPNKPASKSWLRKQTVKMREATGVPHIKPHAFRHLAVTELLESGAPEQTVIAVAGWVSRNMINTYSHSRIEAKSDVLRLLDKKPVDAMCRRFAPECATGVTPAQAQQPPQPSGRFLTSSSTWNFAGRVFR